MKKIFNILICLILIINSNAQQINFCENFDNFSNLDPIAETSPSWNTWGELMSSTVAPFIDDANVLNTQPYSGDYSLYLNDGTGAGGPQDILLVFDTTTNITNATAALLATPYIDGSFVFSQMMYIVSGKTGYFNFQAENIPGIEWSLEVNFDVNGGVSMSNTSGTTFNCSYPGSEVWFEIKFNVDLSNNIWEVLIDGVSQGVFSNGVNRIAALDLYPGVNSEYYVDDICYSYDTTQMVLDNLNLAASSVVNISGLEGQLRYPIVNVMNLGSTNINSFDINFDYNGTTITENITGINIITVGTYAVEFTNSITLLGGLNTATATISNINGLGQDDEPLDDEVTTQINAIIPAPGKIVVGEEATGTWCGWCPRGAVALNWMDKDYKGYWQGIAIHNGDPMADADYDNGLAPYIGGYPSGLVDRGSEIDPGDFKQDFLQRIVVEPKAIIKNGAQLKGDTLTVSLTVEFVSQTTGNYSLACVVVEDSVTGISTQYYQNNSYSGGGSGPLIDVDGSDWSNKPSNVPANQVVYRHVGRSIAPSFTGETLSATSYNLGDEEILCYEFILDPSWDKSQIHIVGMLFNDAGTTDNASSKGLYDILDLGIDTTCGSSTPTPASSGFNLNGPDRINIFPNPAKEYIYISNLQEKSKIEIYDINGRVVLKTQALNKEYVDVSSLSKGIYQIKFKGKKWSETRKLIKD